MKRRLRQSLPVAIAIGLSVLRAEDLREEREWTDAQGRSIRASLLGFEEDRLSMRREDGLEFTLDMEKLSADDREAVLALREKEEAAAAATKPPRRAQETPPRRLKLEEVEMVVQHGNFCVPASATMIAGIHGDETSQEEVARLSSEASISNEGTYPRDMLLAMNKLSFRGRQIFWAEREHFAPQVLPAIRRHLAETGPVYISFKPGVFGSMGHGCVIVGYDDRKERLLFYNPWGNEFDKGYLHVADEGIGIVLIFPPEEAPVADEAFVGSVRRALPVFPGGIEALHAKLSGSKLPFELVWCSRGDSRQDKRFAEDTARREGRKILELAFERNPAVIVPHSPAGETGKYYFVTRPPAGGANFLVREITGHGWSEPELLPLGRLTREWTTRLDPGGDDGTIWELPLFELRLP